MSTTREVAESIARRSLPFSAFRNESEWKDTVAFLTDAIDKTLQAERECVKGARIPRKRPRHAKPVSLGTAWQDGSREGDQVTHRREATGMDTDDLTKEPRTVYGLAIGEVGYRVGGDGITAIEPIDVTGQMAYVPWFNVWRGQTLVCKVNAAHVHIVEYEPVN